MAEQNTLTDELGIPEGEFEFMLLEDVEKKIVAARMKERELMIEKIKDLHDVGNPYEADERLSGFNEGVEAAVDVIEECRE